MVIRCFHVGFECPERSPGRLAGPFADTPFCTKIRERQVAFGGGFRVWHNDVAILVASYVLGPAPRISRTPTESQSKLGLPEDVKSYYVMKGGHGVRQTAECDGFTARIIRCS